MCDARNIREVSALDIDMMGFDFYPSSERFVQMISSQAGIVPDFSPERLKKATRPEETGNTMVPKRISRVGVFVDDMPQSIISRVYNYSLDFVQLNGDESEVMIDNLKRSLVPDLVPEIKVIKAFDICSTADFARCSVFESCTDLFLFNIRCGTKTGRNREDALKMAKAYNGKTPFLLGGNIGLDDAEAVKSLHYPQFAGVDLNEQFEVSAGIKNVERLQKFIAEVK